MPRSTPPHRFPPRAALLRFLRERTPVSVHAAARLLGATPARLRRRARADGVLLPDGLLPWEEVAFELFAVWPRAAILDTLGDAIDLVPRGLHLTRPAWDVPIYLVQAMEEQARAARGVADPVADHVADVLHQAIDPDLIRALRRDPAFVAAYDYPHGDFALALEP